MAEMVQLPVVETHLFDNDRIDNWRIRPIVQGIYLVVFVIYALWAAALDSTYFYKEIGNTRFVSPLYNPEVHLSWWPENLSPGLIFIWIPIGFRATCYYARKVYYRSLFWKPPGCAVSAARPLAGKYHGETAFPFILNNIHRYFFYLAFILATLHVIEFIRIVFEGGFTTLEGGIAAGILGLDALFLAMYVLSCHACKHIVGGGMNTSTGSGLTRFRFSSWKFVKKLNEHHADYFWISLTTVFLADLYIRFVLARNIFGIVG